MTEALLTRETLGAVARITLNRPGALNALSDGMLAALGAEVEAIAADRGVRAVILAGAGKAFCAGHDLREMQAGRQAEDGGKAYFAELFGTCGAVMQRLQSLPQPVIAQVHGIAAAAGCQLAASCDMVVCAEDARFGVNGVNIGLFCSTPMVALSRVIPRKAAFEMLTTGRFIGAEEAQRLGLVSRIAAPQDLEAEALALATEVAGKLSAAVKIGKEAFYQQMQMPLEAAYDYTGEVMVENLSWRDTDEGMQAFLEKRDPDWKET